MLNRFRSRARFVIASDVGKEDRELDAHDGFEQVRVQAKAAWMARVSHQAPHLLAARRVALPSAVIRSAPSSEISPATETTRHKLDRHVAQQDPTVVYRQAESRKQEEPSSSSRWQDSKLRGGLQVDAEGENRTGKRISLIERIALWFMTKRRLQREQQGLQKRTVGFHRATLLKEGRSFSRTRTETEIKATGPQHENSETVLLRPQRQALTMDRQTAHKAIERRFPADDAAIPENRDQRIRNDAVQERRGRRASEADSSTKSDVRLKSTSINPVPPEAMSGMRQETLDLSFTGTQLLTASQRRDVSRQEGLQGDSPRWPDENPWPDLLPDRPPDLLSLPKLYVRTGEHRRRLHNEQQGS